MSIEIRQVDPADERAIRVFYDVYVTCGRHDSVSFIATPYDELALVVRQPTEDFSYTAFLAYDGDDVVAEGWYAAFLRANLDKAVVRPRVLPRQRRRGLGSAILSRLEDHARADGRAIVQASPRWAMEHGPEGAGSPGVEFARKHGYPVRLVEAERRLALPVCAELLDELCARSVGTLVRRAHRGHGLGCGLKAAVIRLLQQERPEISATITSNALTNTAMVAVNDRLGYEIIEYLGDVQKRL